MSNESITLDGQQIFVTPGQTILEVARQTGIDIPTLCYLEKCGPLTSCQVCLVKVDGKLTPSCGTIVRPGMIVESETSEVHEARKTALELLFSDHVGDCLAPCQKLCPFGLNIPVLLRQVESDSIPEAIKTVRSALPLAGVLGRLCHHPCEQGCRRGHWDDPAGIRNIERFAVDQEAKLNIHANPPKKLITGRKVAVIGAGPVGVSASWYLVREGHTVVIFDRNTSLGGSLNHVPNTDLPGDVLDHEARILRDAGVAFEFGTALGRDVPLDELCGTFDAVLLAPGELTSDEALKMGLAGCMSTSAESAGNPTQGSPIAIKTDAITYQTQIPKVFAAGAAVRPARQLVRAMTEGKAVAECINRFLANEKTSRAAKPFSSTIGRLQQDELKRFLVGAKAIRTVSPCDKCAGLNRAEAPSEAARCLHCDCVSSGNCLLQHYAQQYNVDAGRFRGERKPFVRHAHPGGVVFEPGKCILCGICVKLTELAAEPLGLTFVGRGFDVQIAAPLNHTIEEGLKKVAAECVEHCPTGALAFARPRKSSTDAPAVPAL